MTRTIVCLLILCCACRSDFSAADEPAPGSHRKLPCTGAPNQTYDLFLPKAYAEHQDARFPVLFISGSGGNPGFLKLEPWAERQGVVLVTINNSKNGPTGPIIEAQNAVTKTVIAKLRLHHCLRFSIGHSGAAVASGILAAQFGDDWAGVVFCINSQRDVTFKRHVALAYIAGIEHKTYPIHLVREDVATAKAAGNPVRVIERDVGHTRMDEEDITDMLDWMLELERLSHPLLTPQERQEGQAHLKARIAAVKAMKPDKACLDIASSLLSIEGIAATAMARDLKESWLNALLATTDDSKDPIAAHLALNEAAQSPWVSGISGTTRQTLDKRLIALRALPAVKADMESRQALAQVKALESQAGTSRTLRQNVVAQYDAIAKRWPGTDAGATAKAALKRLSPNKAK